MNSRISTRIAIASALAASFAFTNPVLAATATGSLSVKLVIQDGCTINAQPLDFGTHSGIPGNIDAQTKIGVSCTSDTAFAIGLGVGKNLKTINDRQMTNTGDATKKVPYQLYLDLARTKVFGLVGTPEEWKVPKPSGDRTATNIYVDVFGRVPTLTNVSVGTYTDTVDVTVSY